MKIFKDNKAVWTVVFAGLILIPSAVSTLIYYYLNSPNVTRHEWGGPAEFGQFGDMIGGLINPLFGLFTTTMLLMTYFTAHRDSLRESRKNDKSEIKHMLEEFSQYLSDQKNERNLTQELASGVWIDSINHANNPIQTIWIEGIVKNLAKTAFENLELENKYEEQSYRAVSDMRSIIKSVAELHIELIDPEGSETVNKFI